MSNSNSGAPTPLPTASKPRPTININVSGELRLTNGLVLTIDRQTVTLEQPGPQGGRGNVLKIPIGEWEAVNAAVVEVKAAMDRAIDRTS